MQSRYKISQQPNSRLKEFPFYDLEPGSNEAFFVPSNESGRDGQKIRYYAKMAGVKIKMRQRQEGGVMGYFVWVTSVSECRKIAPPPQIQHAAE